MWPSITVSDAPTQSPKQKSEGKMGGNPAAYRLTEGHGLYTKLSV